MSWNFPLCSGVHSEATQMIVEYLTDTWVQPETTRRQIDVLQWWYSSEF